MKQRRINRLLAATVSSLGIVLSAGAGANSFNFDYQPSGDRSVQPYQVFDDGQSTYLQFRQGSILPKAIFVVDANGNRRLVEAQHDGPYLRIDAVTARIDLVGERSSATLQTSKRVPAPARQVTPEVAPAVSAPAPAAAPVVPVQVVPVQHVQPAPVAVQAGTMVYSRPAPRTAPVYESPVYYAPAQSAPPTAYAQPAPQRVIEAPVAQPVPVASAAAPVVQRQDDVAELRQQVAQLTQLVMALAKRMDAQIPASAQIGAQPVQAPRLMQTSTKAVPVEARPTAAPTQQAQQLMPRVQQPQQPRQEQPVSVPAHHVPVVQTTAPVLPQTPVQPERTHLASVTAQEPAAPAPAPEPAPNRQAMRPATFEITVHSGQRLSDAVRRFVAGHALDLDWDTGGADFEIKFGFKVAGGSMEDVLLSVLSPFKLSAVTRTGNGVVSVTRAA